MNIAPFLACLGVFLKNDVGTYKYFLSGVRFKRLVKCFEDVTARETFRVTFDERFAPLREKAQAAAA
ncbi:hypothetical protein C8R44DRAFT_806068, partial [Mycena epipterygia]